MERRLMGLHVVRLLCLPSRTNRNTNCHRHKARDFATILMLVAVAGVVCQAINTLIDLGRSAGWWQ